MHAIDLRLFKFLLCRKVVNHWCGGELGSHVLWMVKPLCEELYSFLKLCNFCCAMSFSKRSALYKQNAWVDIQGYDERFKGFQERSNGRSFMMFQVFCNSIVEVELFCWEESIRLIGSSKRGCILKWPSLLGLTPRFIRLE